MNEPEKFLTRWSRRKRVADEAREQPGSKPPVDLEVQATPPAAADGKPENQPQDKQAIARAPATTGKNAIPEPAFDPASLPSLDSIGADTDIRGYLKPGVPNDLQVAALRRAWSADPAIRDFVGLQDYDWDFTDPHGVLGFGELDASFDVKKALANIMGDTPRAGEPVAELPAEPEQPMPLSLELSGQPEPTIDHAANLSARPDIEKAVPSPDEGADVHHNKNIATQDGDSNQNKPLIKPRRSHGGALPQ
jgi:hypothetical protein